MNRTVAQEEGVVPTLDPSLLQEPVVITAIHHQRADEPLPEIRGFVRSPFNPLIYHSVRQAVHAAGKEQGDWPDSARVGIALGSMFVDAVTEEESWRDILQGKKLSPIMFPQSVPSAIIGLLARELTIHGPMTCIGTSRDSWGVMLDMAKDWMASDYADLVVLTMCEVPSLRSQAWEAEMGIEGDWIGGVLTVVAEKTDLAKQRGRLQEALTLEQFHTRYLTEHKGQPVRCGVPGFCMGGGEA